jgi:hydroxymethylpyrimidine/phosphomethylpyrimidine kinase
VVLDPVMVAKSGDRLLAKDAIKSLVENLFPLAEVITPNLEEAIDLLGIDAITNIGEMKDAAHLLHRLGAKSVLLKGGHITKGAVDVFFDGGEPVVLEGRHIETPHTHGTGCTLSSAIAAGLAIGNSISESVQSAKEYIQGAIENSLSLGGGRGPLNHMYRQSLENRE